MYKSDYSIYLGNEVEDLHIDFTSGDNFFMIVETGNHAPKEELKSHLTMIKDAVESDHIDSLKGMVSLVDKHISQWQDDTSFATAVILVAGDVAYMLTRGKGEIFVGRDGNVQKLMDGSQTSSGYIKNDDYFVLTVPAFSARVSTDTLAQTFIDADPHQVIETLTPDLKGDDDTGLIALFLQFSHVPMQESTEDTTEITDDEVTYVAEEAESNKGYGNIKLTSSTSKKITFAAVLILSIIFIWSVVLGNQRRMKQTFEKKVQSERTLINQKLSEAEDVATGNIQKSVKLIAEARAVYEGLVTEATAKKIKDVKELVEIKDTIDQKERLIKKTEQGHYEEFYDLNLIEKGAHANDTYLDGDDLAILDKNNGKVYILSLDKKSVQTHKTSAAKNATFVALHQGEPYLFSKNKGITKIAEDKKETVVIPADTEWSMPKDFYMYSGNIYLLDIRKDEIYKYLVAENGYSDKSSYFKSGNAIDLQDAKRIAIDASLYVINGKNVIKFTSGLKQSFDLSLPDQDIDFENIFTSKDLDDIYLLDTDNGKIFITDKDGVFKKQISAGILSKADDFFVTSTQEILVLSGKKIYKVSE